MLNLSKLSQETLIKFQKVIEIIFEQIDLLGNSRSRFEPIKISVKKFKQKGLFYDEVQIILKRLGKEQYNIKQVSNDFDIRPRFISRAIMMPGATPKANTRSDYFYLMVYNTDKLTSLLYSIKTTKNVNQKRIESKKVKYITEEGHCYLKTSKKNIKIGKINTRKCKLLQCLSSPLGIAQTIDTVFGKIQLPKDEQNKELWSEYLGRGKKEPIIKTTGKEIQRILSKKKAGVSLSLHVENRMAWIEFN